MEKKEMEEKKGIEGGEDGGEGLQPLATHGGLAAACEQETRRVEEHVHISWFTYLAFFSLHLDIKLPFSDQKRSSMPTMHSIARRSY